MPSFQTDCTSCPRLVRFRAFESWTNLEKLDIHKIEEEWWNMLLQLNAAHKTQCWWPLKLTCRGPVFSCKQTCCVCITQLNINLKLLWILQFKSLSSQFSQSLFLCSAVTYLKQCSQCNRMKLKYVFPDLLVTLVLFCNLQRWINVMLSNEKHVQMLRETHDAAR